MDLLGSEKRRGIQWVDYCALGRGRERGVEEVCILGACPSLGNVRVHSSYFYVAIKLLPGENLINLLCGNQLDDKRRTLVIKL